MSTRHRRRLEEKEGSTVIGVGQGVTRGSEVTRARIWILGGAKSGTHRSRSPPVDEEGRIEGLDESERQASAAGHDRGRCQEGGEEKR